VVDVVLPRARRDDHQRQARAEPAAALLGAERRAPEAGPRRPCRPSPRGPRAGARSADRRVSPGEPDNARPAACRRCPDGPRRDGPRGRPTLSQPGFHFVTRGYCRPR
jgi:hypothetical protein